MEGCVFLYQSCYCEENIWHLLNELQGSDSRVLFFINREQSVLLMNQEPFGGAGVGCWDYHVALLDFQRQVIFDFDSRLGFGVQARSYLEQTVPDPDRVVPAFQTTIRVIDGPDYLGSFSSDRSHMLDGQGRFLAEPPPWDPIQQLVRPLNLVDLKTAGLEDERIRDYDVVSFLQTFLR